jgi:hypothetical protein
MNGRSFSGPVSLFARHKGSPARWHRACQATRRSGLPWPKPSFTRAQFDTVRDMLRQQMAGIAHVAKTAKLSRRTVYRIKADPAGAEAALSAWGL